MDNKELFRKFGIEILGSNNDQEQNSVLNDYLKILTRWKWLIAMSTFAIVIPATIWTFVVAPIYKAEATIIYEEANDTAFLLDLGQNSYGKSAILNMIEQIKSRTMAEVVAKSLPAGVVKMFKMPEKRSETFSEEKYIAGIIKNNLEVQNLRGADIIKIRVEAGQPYAAKTIANAYVDHIIDWNIQKNKSQISNIRNFVEGQLSVFQDRLRESEENLLEYKEKNDLVTLSDASTEVLASLTEAEVAYNQARAEREALEQRQRFLEKKKQELMPSLVVSNSPLAQQLKNDLLKLETEYSGLQLQSVDENQSQLKLIGEQINKTKQDLIDELMRNAVRENLVDPLSQIKNLLQELIVIEVDLDTYKAREQGLKKNMDEYYAELQLLPKQELELARLIRAQEVNDNIFAILLEKREEARITEAGKVGDVRVIDYAEAPIDPIKPQKKKTVALALILGLSFGVGLAFFFNSLDNSIKSEQDVEKCLNLPVLASIPTFSSNGVLHKVIKKEDKDNSYFPKLFSQTSEKSHVFEAYRTLQLNFSFLNPDKELKSILITSSTPGEGKTLTSVNIAQFYARTGTKTLVVDCDLRRPMVHKALRIRQQPGLTNLLVDKISDLSSVVQSFDNENLDVLTCGTLPPNASELINSHRMERILAEAQSLYELVVIDAPPIISVTDAIVLGKNVDATLLVIRSGKTSREVAQKAKKALENSNSRIAGALLNDVDLKNVYGYYKSYYYYANKKEKNTIG